MTNMDSALPRTAVTLRDGFIMDVFVDEPEKTPPKATVLLLSPIFGVDAIFARTVRLWSRAGYRAVAPDYFGRVFPGTLPHSDEGFRQAIKRVKQVDRAAMLSDLREIGERHGEGSPPFIGGYCAGGEPALQLAIEGLGSGFAIFHAARLGLYADRLSTLAVPVDMHFGADDPLVPMDEVNRIAAAAAGNAHVTLTVHAGAVHGFTQNGSRNYQAAAAEASFEAARRVFDAAVQAQRV